MCMCKTMSCAVIFKWNYFILDFLNNQLVQTYRLSPFSPQVLPSWLSLRTPFYPNFLVHMQTRNACRASAISIGCGFHSPSVWVCVCMSVPNACAHLRTYMEMCLHTFEVPLQACFLLRRICWACTLFHASSPSRQRHRAEKWLFGMGVGNRRLQCFRFFFVMLLHKCSTQWISVNVCA